MGANHYRARAGEAFVGQLGAPFPGKSVKLPGKYSWPDSDSNML